MVKKKTKYEKHKKITTLKYVLKQFAAGCIESRLHDILKGCNLNTAIRHYKNEW